jgi:hypothetical protein
MNRTVLALAVLLSATVPAAGLGQVGSTSAPEPAIPSYYVSFVPGPAVSGASASPAIKLPFQCTSDGTVFVSFVSTVPDGSGLPPPPPSPPPALLTSISASGKGQTFRLDQVPGLYISNEVDHFASDSNVIFLVRGSREDKPVKQAYTVGGYRGEFTRNEAERHSYILTFSREGRYLRTIEIEDAFRMLRIAQFSSGAFLAFGYDATDHSPRLAMLNEDGAVLKFIEIPKGDVPESMISGATAARPHTVAPAELVPEGRSILIALNETTFPLLEIGEGGAVRSIRPKLPKDEPIEALIPSDRNLFVIAKAEKENKNGGDLAGVIYEVAPEDGTVLRRFTLTDGRRAVDEVTCVHDGKFLSIDYSDGKIVPLIGSPGPAIAAAQQHR